MKTILNTLKIVVISLLLSPATSDAQTVEVNDRFWVMSANPSTKEGKDRLTNNAAVNTLFSNYNVTKYKNGLTICKNTCSTKCIRSLM